MRAGRQLGMNLLENWELPRLNVKGVHEVALVFRHRKEALKGDEFGLIVVPLDLADVAVLVTVDASVSVGAKASDHEVFAVSGQVIHVAMVSVGGSVRVIEILAVAAEAFSLMFVELVTSLRPFHRRSDFRWTHLEAAGVGSGVARP